MKSIRTWLFMLFHHHEWTTIHDGPIKTGGTFTGHLYFQQCKVCGDLRKKKLSV